MWLETCAEETGVRPDVIMGTDVVAFAGILEATGPVEVPNERVQDADNAADVELRALMRTDQGREWIITSSSPGLSRGRRLGIAAVPKRRGWPGRARP